MGVLETTYPDSHLDKDQHEVDPDRHVGILLAVYPAHHEGILLATSPKGLLVADSVKVVVVF